MLTDQEIIELAKRAINIAQSRVPWECAVEYTDVTGKGIVPVAPKAKSHGLTRIGDHIKTDSIFFMLFEQAVESK